MREDTSTGRGIEHAPRTGLLISSAVDYARTGAQLSAGRTFAEGGGGRSCGRALPHVLHVRRGSQDVQRVDVERGADVGEVVDMHRAVSKRTGRMRE